MTTTIRSDAMNFGALQVNGSDVLRFGSDNSGQLAGFRNRIINGDFKIWQRGNNIVCPLNTATYTADRWYGFCVGATATAVQGTRPDLPGATTLAFAAGAGNTALNIGHRIEADNCYTLAGKKVTLSGAILSEQARTVVVALYRATAKDNFASPTLITSQNVVLPGGVGIATPFSLSYDVPTSASLGLEISIQFGAVSSTSVSISNVQLEEGSLVTPFEHRPIGLELALCQRYLEYGNSSDPTSAAHRFRAAYNGTWTDSVQMLVIKRGVPTVTAYAQSSGTPGNWRNESAGTDILASVAGVTTARFETAATTVDTSQYAYTWKAESEL